MYWCAGWVLKAQARLLVDIYSGASWHKMAIGLAQCVPSFELTGNDDVVLCVSDDEVRCDNNKSSRRSHNNKYSRSQVLR